MEPLVSSVAGAAAAPACAASAGPAIWPQRLLALAVLATGLALAGGALSISSDAGYGGVGPNFLPWLVSLALLVCGGWMLWEVQTGGFRDLEAAPGAARGCWSGFAWVSAGLLLNAALITRIGFVLGCALCYLLAVQGLRRAAAQTGTAELRTWLVDGATGLLIAAPVYWAFTRFLAINLPGLTASGWI